MYYYGAQHDLAQQIKTHLFVISPNNSGSTFLKNVLATCPNTWNLRREGQHAFGFGGPTPTKLEIPYLWASEQRYLDALTAPEAFDWEVVKKAWYFQAFSENPDAQIFVEKSPPFLLHVNALSRCFTNPRFLFMVRNPYAVAEGISRATGSFYSTRELAMRAAAIHIDKCFRLQRNNLDTYGDQGIFFTYESLCENSDLVQEQILEFVPELESLTLKQQIAVKGNYDEPLRNMNQQQVERLSDSDVDILNEVFDDRLLHSFDYTAKPRSKMSAV